MSEIVEFLLSHAQISGYLTAVAALIAAISSMRNSQKLKKVHIELNDRLSQLILAARAEGAVKERADQDARDLKSNPRRPS